MRTARFLLLPALCLGLLQPALAAKPGKPLSVVRVNVTCQTYDFVRPWTKKTPFTLRGLGAVLAGNRVLVTGEMVMDATYVELEKPQTGEKTAATVECVDYEANLALLKPSDARFLDETRPLSLTPATVGQRLAIWQLEATGDLAATDGLVTAIEVGRYPMDDTAFLLYRLSSPLQVRDSSYTLPIVREGRLAGLLMRQDSRTQTVEAVPQPIIEHFLKAAAAGPYRGFPSAGMTFSRTRDPQFRRYLGLNGNSKDKLTGGVYVATVLKGRPADRAGVKAGDVLLAIDGVAIDQDGNYNDPQYGRIALTHLISVRHADGDAAKLKLLRGASVIEVPVTLNHHRADDHVVPPYVADRAPRFQILGGLILLELSKPYLKEWGREWWKDAPLRLVCCDRFQTELFQDGRRRVIILSQILPSPLTIGYEDLRYQVVTKLNGVELKSFDDVTAAIKKPLNGFHKIELQDDPKEIYLDAAQAAAAEAPLMKLYGLPAISR
ncbi:MAG: PDZ domain-containing protein [Verrucomicrobia bacterium]|nr:PDZ domain-containing protein [Verrucomicrobiota bacterium]